jgi:hypothetical protein
MYVLIKFLSSIDLEDKTMDIGQNIFYGAVALAFGLFFFALEGLTFLSGLLLLFGSIWLIHALYQYKTGKLF